MGEAADAVEAGPRAEDGQRQDEEVVLVVADADAGAMRGVPETDRRADPCTVAATVAFIKGLFHQTVILRPDHEGVMMDLANKVEAELPKTVVVRPAPTFSSQTNPSENANGTIQA
eukprot:2664412-Pyramimonas_sp.AAC.1